MRELDYDRIHVYQIIQQPERSARFDRNLSWLSGDNFAANFFARELVRKYRDFLTDQAKQIEIS